MKQQINLIDLVIEKQKKLNGKTLLVACGALGLLLVGFSTYQFTELSSLADQENSVIAQRDKAQEQLDLLLSQIPSDLNEEALKKELETLNEQIESKADIVALLSSDKIGNKDGFSPFLEGLAAQIGTGIWLTNISVSEGGTGLSLIGTATAPELVPIYIQNLAAEPAFAGTEFKIFQLTRNKSQSAYIDYYLNTREKASSTESAGSFNASLDTGVNTSDNKLRMQSVMGSLGK
ncbi:MAG: PilN domain-containing protein [Gammaproteobacteria bacterium]